MWGWLKPFFQLGLKIFEYVTRPRTVRQKVDKDVSRIRGFNKNLSKELYEKDTKALESRVDKLVTRGRAAVRRKKRKPSN